MEGEGGVSLRIVDELYSWDIQSDQMESGGGVTRSIIDEFILWISKDFKW